MAGLDGFFIVIGENIIRVIEHYCTEKNIRT